MVLSAVLKRICPRLFHSAELRGAYPVMVLPLSQIVLPVMPSTANNSAEPFIADAESPLDRAKTTPLTTRGASGALSPFRVQPYVSETELPFTATL